MADPIADELRAISDKYYPSDKEAFIRAEARSLALDECIKVVREWWMETSSLRDLISRLESLKSSLEVNRRSENG